MTKEIFEVGAIIYIDDKMNDEEVCRKLVNEAEMKNYIIQKFDKIPSKEFIEKNKDIIGMIVMDWSLEVKEGSIGKELTEKEKQKNKIKHEEQIKINKEFIEHVLKFCLPVVIFTQTSKNELEDELIDCGLIESSIDENPLLYACEKTVDLTNIMTKWIEKIPSKLFFDQALSGFYEAKRQTFQNVILNNNNWIKPLWELTYANKTVNSPDYKESDLNSLVSSEFSKQITNSVFNRIQDNINFNSNFYLDKLSSLGGDNNDARKVLESTRFVTNSQLHRDSTKPGDLFKSSDNIYFLNIRAECDTERAIDGQKLLYVLQGSLVSLDRFYSREVCSRCEEKHSQPQTYLGTYKELRFYGHSFVIPFVDNGKIIKFNFRDLFVIPVKDSSFNKKFRDGGNDVEKKFMRVGRILPPYITAIQQRYAQYFNRIGLDAVPDKN